MTIERAFDIDSEYEYVDNAESISATFRLTEQQIELYKLQALSVFNCSLSLNLQLFIFNLEAYNKFLTLIWKRQQLSLISKRQQFFNFCLESRTLLVL